MTYPPPSGSNPDPYGQQQPPQDPFAASPPNPYAQQQPTDPTSSPPAAPYGQPYGQQPYGYSTPTPQQNSMALTAMILSLVGLATWITAPVGAILGHIALKQIRQTGETGEGMAKTGIIVGWIITGFGVLCCIGYIVVLVIGIGASTTSY